MSTETMDDRELLELAAKAAGYGYGEFVKGGIVFATEDSLWNPLTDDADAFRLAVQLELEVSFIGDDTDGRDSECSVGYPESAERPCKIKYVFEPHNGDIFAATRRAIVRAAAMLAKGAEAR